MDRRGDTGSVAVTVRLGGGAGGSIIAVATAVLSGAANAAWTRLRSGLLGVPMPPPESGEAAYGAALLALPHLPA